MRFQKLGLLLTLLLSCSLSFAQHRAGGNSGGGANAVVCRDKQGKITSAELVDIFEGRYENGFTYNNSKSDSVENILNKAVEKFKKANDRIGDKNGESFRSEPYWYWADGDAWNLISVPNYFKKFDEKFKILDDVATPALLEDYNLKVKPKKCSVERLAFYNDKSGKIFIDKEVWNHFDNLNKAALIFHEASYFYGRTISKSTDSDETREIVAKFFADQHMPGLFDNLDGKTCITHKAIITITSPIDQESIRRNIWTEYIYSQDKDGNHYLSFGSVLGKQVFSQTMVKFEKTPINNSYGNAIVINSDIELPPMRLLHFPKEYRKEKDHNGNVRTYLSEIEGSKKIVLQLFAVKGHSFSEIMIDLTDDSGVFYCGDNSKIEITRPR